MSLLQVDDVSRHFGSLVAVENVSMSVEAGELRAVLARTAPARRRFSI